MAKLFAASFFTALDGDGVPISGAKLNFYLTGTTTPTDTFTDSALSVAHANPVVADAAGRFAPIYLTGKDIKAVLTDANDVTIPPEIDPVPGGVGPILDGNGNEVLEFGEVASAVNHLKITNAATGNAPKVEALGGDTDIGADYQTKGIGVHTFKKGGGETVLEASGPASTVNNLHLKATATGASPSLDAEGTDTNIGVAFNPQGTGNLEPYGVAWPTLFAGHIRGLILSNGTDTEHDIDITAGVCTDGGDAWILNLAAALTKQIDATWAVGTDAGGLDGTESVTGTPDASTLYYVWLIKRSDTGVVDALFSESGTAPTMPTDYDYKRLIGAVETDGSANIINVQFMQARQGKKTFVSAAQTITSAALRTLTTGLGAIPDRVHAELVNVTDQFGLVTGEVIPINYSVSTFASNARGISVALTSSQIRVRFGSDANAVSLINNTDGNAANITNANWTLRMRAEVDT